MRSSSQFVAKAEGARSLGGGQAPGAAVTSWPPSFQDNPKTLAAKTLQLVTGSLNRALTLESKTKHIIGVCGMLSAVCQLFENQRWGTALPS